MKDNELERYSVIDNKNPREILLLRGSGCVWRKCRFCDYHLDYCKNDNENFEINKKAIEQVTGKYGVLEVVNSGSFVDLDEKTMKLIMDTCTEKNIKQIHFESHWMHRDEIENLRQRFASIGVNTKLKIGVETFDYLFRESYLVKGIDTDSPSEIAKYFNEVCLLFGIPGQTKESMLEDIKIGLEHFDRICINIMQKNTKAILPDPRVIKTFADEIYDLYIDNDRVDILMVNTDFGIG